MTNRLDPVFVMRQIELLRLTHPQIWDDDDEALLADMLEAETGLKEFLEVLMRRALKDDAEVVHGTEAILTEIKARHDRYEQRIEDARALAFKLMQQAGLPKIELPIATLSIRAGVPKIIITDESALPPDCVRVRTEPNKIAIKERLARGEPVPGAEMSNAEPVLAVRK